ncbi:MAG: D-alanine--D-alanine ligase [Lachnospiraceae bacterium]|nr:D-alanine--D-alanine ligase [Lachnospiraceae bacterium]
MNIVVLAGGISTERDVSLVTGVQVTNALVKKGHRAVMVDVFMGDENATDPEVVFEGAHLLDAAKITENAPDLATVKESRGASKDGFFGPNVLSLCKAADLVFMGLHGEDGENGKIQATFDLLGIRYTGTGYLGSALAMNKDIAKELFVKHDVPTPKGITVTKDNCKKVKVSYPCVVKPACGGSSVGVSIARNDEEYQKALDAAFAWEEKLVVEQYVHGREFSIGVVDGVAYPIIEIAPLQGFYDYKNKYQAGSTVETCPAELLKEQTETMQKHAVNAYHALKLDTYGRMDFLMDEEGKMYCLEANTLPGMTPTSLLPQEAAALGYSFEDLCENLVKVSLKKYE